VANSSAIFAAFGVYSFRRNWRRKFLAEVFLFTKDYFSFGQRAPLDLLLRLLARKYVKLPLHRRFASAV
jgi:hypothetical protein